MLKRITLENFFSFGEPTTIELNPDVNVLVGINGSGKSNFLKAIRLLYEGVAGQGFEKTFLQEWGGFDAVANVCGGKKDYIKLEFEFSASLITPKEDHYENIEINDYKYEIAIYKFASREYFLNEKFGRKDGDDFKVFIDVEKGIGKLMALKDESATELELVDYPSNFFFKEYSKKELIFRQVKNHMRGFLWVSNTIENCSIYNQFETSFNSPIREATVFGTEEKLLPTGENLNTIIQKLKNNHSLDYEKIEELLRDINPNFKDIGFNLFGSRSYLLLREKNLAKAISIEHVSDGTLRFLLLLSIFYNPNRGSLVCLDEPEMGLHPDMIRTIAKGIRHAAETTQMFIATHSPLLLNAFELDEILIFEKDKNNQTQVIIKSEEDFDNWNEDYLVGQLWLSGQIGGKRW